MKYTKRAATSQRLRGLLTKPSDVICDCNNITTKFCAVSCV